jgi:hypothetical protein
MSGLFKRLSSRRSAGLEGSEPKQATEPGAADEPASTPAEPEVRPSLLTDPAAPTRVLREGEQPTRMTSGDPLASRPAESGEPEPTPRPAAVDPNTPAPFGPHPAGAQPGAYAPVYGPQPAGAEPNPFVPAPYGPQPAPYVAPSVEPIADLPAGLDPDELAAAPGTSARRGKLRRRAAFLRAARELLLRDLGGFVYELHRTAHDIEHPAHRALRETKLSRLTRVDAELHELETRLDDVRRQVLVREPGVGGECPHCGELFGSAAHYCSHCGNPLTEAARRELAKAQQPAADPAQPVVAPEPAAAAEPTPAAPDQPTEEIKPLDDPNAAFEWPPRPATGADATTPVGEGQPSTAGDAVPVGEGEPATTMLPADASGAAQHEHAPRGDATPVGEGDPVTTILPADASGEVQREDAPGGDATPVGEGEPATTMLPADVSGEVQDEEAPRGDATPVGEGEPATTSIAAGDTPAAGDEAPRVDVPEDATPVGEGEPARTSFAAGDDAPETPDAGDEATRGDAGQTPREDEAAAGGEAPRNDAAGEGGEGRPRGDDGPRGDAAAETNGTTGDAPRRDYETWRGQAANGHDDSIFSPVERRP